MKIRNCLKLNNYNTTANQDKQWWATSVCIIKIINLNSYVIKSEVKTFDPSGDSTLPTYPKKRKIEQVDKEDEVIEKKAKKAKVKIKG